MILTYLRHPLIQLEKDILLLEALVPAMPRVVYDSVVKYNNIEELFHVFEQRKIARAKAISGVVHRYGDMSISLRNVKIIFLL